LIGGDFTTYNNIPVNRIARLLPNGNLDPTFNVGAGANNWVRFVFPEENGDVLVGGDFTSFKNTPLSHLVKLDSLGSVVSSFSNNVSGINGRVMRIVKDTSNRYLVMGDFTRVSNSTNSSKISRLNLDGSVDQTFNIGSGPSHEIRGGIVQNTGKIVIAGYAIGFQGFGANRILRLQSNGAYDPNFFVSNQSIGPLYDIKQQQNSKFLICGAFLTYNNLPFPYLVRLNADGFVDEDFTVGAGPNAGVEFIKIANDGSVFICGNFTTYNGFTVGRIAKLHGDTVVGLSNTLKIRDISLSVFPNPAKESITVKKNQKTAV